MSGDAAAPGEAGHPVACPWCGQCRVRGVTPSPDGNRWYRCAACTTTFFIHATTRHPLAPDAEHWRLGRPA